MKKRVLLILSCLFLSIGFVVAQTTKASGVVLDDTGETLPGVTVVVKGTTTGTITDIDGKFDLIVPANNQDLVFSLLGMKKVEAKAAVNMKITLQNDDATALDEVMVVAFGTAKKAAFTGSAGVINADELSKHVTTNIANSLVGNVSGVQMRSGTGAPGGDNGKINIRGIASMYADTEPLIIVDGAPYTASLSNIPQGDVESITVLKDAASAALYGARGAAGVILVTTKKGKLQGPSINVDVKWGSNSRAVQDYDVIKSPAAYYEAYYNQLYNRYYYGEGYSATQANASANSLMLTHLGYNIYSYPSNELLIGMDGKINPNATMGRKQTYNGTDYYMQADNWTDKAYRNALRQEYNVTVNSATERSSFYASVGYLKDEGIIEYSSYDRVSARLRADTQLNKWVKLAGNVSYIHSNQESNPNLDTTSGSTNLMYFVSNIAPIYPIYVRVVDANGNVSIRKDQYGHDSYDYGVAASNYGVKRPFLQTGNPLGSNRYNTADTQVNLLNGNFNADFTLTSYLKANVSSTVIWGETEKTNYQNAYEGPKTITGGSIDKNTTTNIKTNNIQTLTFLKTFGEHDFDFMIGHEYYRNTNRYIGGTAQGSYSNDIQELDAFGIVTGNSSYKTVYNLEGYFSRAQYNYASKYFASASFRRDASSNFAKENRWGNFWSVGGAWILNKETFLSSQKWIDMLKFKASIGQQGNDNIGNFKYTTLYNLVSDGTVVNPIFSRKGTPDITWETTTTFSTGIEFGVLNNILTGSFEFYNKKTTDLLFSLSVPESAGYRARYANIGDLKNNGIEVSLTGNIIRSKEMDLSITTNLSHNATKITKLPDLKTAANGGYTESSMWYEVGGPLYNAFRAKYAGVNSEGLATYWVDDELNGSTSKPGKNYSRTTTNFNEASKYALGSMLPKVFGGFNLNFRYRDFDAFVAFDYQLGGKVYDARYAKLMTPGVTASSAGSNFHKDYAKSWSPNNTSSDIPRWQYGDSYTTAASDRFLTRASYLNFQSFSVGYTFPKNLVKYVSKIRIYAAGENLCFWSARKGFDPRYSYSATESMSVYSPVRNISGGLQLSF